MSAQPFNLPKYRTRTARKHDCGAHGPLSVPEIARFTGLSTNSIYARLATGVRGEALCAPRIISRRKSGIYRDGEPLPISGGAIYIACTIAREFRNPPTVEQLRARFSMSRATAFRWRRAWLDANRMAA